MVWLWLVVGRLWSAVYTEGHSNLWKKMENNENRFTETLSVGGAYDILPKHQNAIIFTV